MKKIKPVKFQGGPIPPSEDSFPDESETEVTEVSEDNILADLGYSPLKYAISYSDAKVYTKDDLQSQWMELQGKKLGKSYASYDPGSMLDGIYNSVSVKGPGMKCGCGDPACTLEYKTLLGENEYVPPPSIKSMYPKAITKKKGFKNSVVAVDDPFESFSKKDLIGVIRNLLEESGGTGVKVMNSGQSFLTRDAIVALDGPIPYLAFRSLVDKLDEESELQ